MTILFKHLISQSIAAAIAITSTVFISTAVRAESLTSEDSNLSELLVNNLLQQTSELSRLPISDLKIVDAKPITWTNGCMGLRNRDICTMALVRGWIITVENQQQRWIYHTGRTNGTLAAHYWWTFDNQQNKLVYHMENNSWYLQDNFIWWDFQNTSNAFQYDWSKVKGFRYTISNGSFSGIHISKKAIELENLFSVLVGDTLIGQVGFSDGSISFRELPNVPVSEFTITNINPLVDLRDATSFSLFLEFNSPRDPYSWNRQSKFSVEVLQKVENSSTSIPEPASPLSLLTFGTFGLISALKRKVRNLL